MGASGIAIAGGNKTVPKKAISLFRRVERERKILLGRVRQEFYSLEFSLSGTRSAGMPDASARIGQ
jgi:hypothetical protein